MAWGTFNISGSSYVRSKSFSPDELYSVFFKSDGSKMYVGAGSIIKQYSLSTPWDISTATYDNKSISESTSSQYGVFLSSDGTKLFNRDYSNYRVLQRTLSTPWDIDTGGTVTSFNDGYRGGQLFFKPDGTKMYLFTASNGAIRQYTLSTAWNITTASYDSKSYNPSLSHSGLFMNDIGTKMYITDQSSNTIRQYTLSTAWDVSTATYDNVDFSISQGISDSHGLFFKQDDGTKFFISRRNDKNVYQYTAYTPITFIPQINFIT